MGTPVVGMLGLGDIGLPIARRIAAFFPVLAYDPRRTSEDCEGALQLAASVDEVAAGASLVVCCLPSAKVSIAVASEIAATQKRRATTILELSTIGFDAANEIADLAARDGIGYLDAPISGSVSKAAHGTLTVMASGPPAEMERARPLLETIASHVFFLGERPGLGQAMKLANNIINATAMAVTCEAVAFGTRVGLDMTQMIEVLNVSTGRTSASVEKFPHAVLPGTFAFGARGEIVRKDAELFVDAARAAGLPTSIADATAELWRAHVAANPASDVSVVYRYVSERPPEDGTGGA